MDDDRLIDQLRAHGEHLDDGADGSDVDALVHGAVLRGRRRRTRRRVTGAVSGLVVAALAVVALGVADPSVLRGLPADPPVAGTPVPRSAAPEPSASPTPTPATTGRVSGRPADVRTTLAGLLPGSLEVTAATAAREEGSNGFAWEHNAALTVRDDEGTAYVLGGIGDGHFPDGCLGLADCTATDVPGGGTVWVTRSPGGDKSGADRTFTYDRPDGGHVWLMERNAPGGAEPVSRPGLPLADAVGRAVVTSADWDALFQG